MNQKGFIEIIVIIGVLILVVAGVAYYFGFDHGFEKPIENAKSPSPEASSLITTDENTNLKKYTNQQYFYTVSYPKHWDLLEAKESNDQYSASIEKLIEEQQKVTFYETRNDNSARGEFEIRVITNKENPTLEQIVNYYYKDRNINNITDIKIDSVPAKKFSVFEYDKEGAVIGIIYNGNIYYLHYSNADPNDSDFEEHRIIYDQILSTFKFTK